MDLGARAGALAGLLLLPLHTLPSHAAGSQTRGGAAAESGVSGGGQVGGSLSGAAARAGVVGGVATVPTLMPTALAPLSPAPVLRLSETPLALAAPADARVAPPAPAAGLAPAGRTLPPLDLAGFRHIVFDVRGSRGGKGDVAAAYLTAADLIGRAVTDGPRPSITFIADDAERKILAGLSGKTLADANRLFDGQVEVVSGLEVSRRPPADLFLALAAPTGEYARRKDLMKADGTKPVPKTWIPIFERGVVINQTVLGNTESADRGRATALVGDRRIELSNAGVAEGESGVYADPVALGLRGKASESVRRHLIDEIGDDVRPPLAALRGYLQGSVLAGAEPALVYTGTKVKPQLRGYLRGLAAQAGWERKSYLVTSPSSITPEDVKSNWLLSRRIVFLDPGQPMPEKARPGRVYILNTGALPHPVFVGMMAYAAPPPLVAGDGAMSAAIMLGRPFALNRVPWNARNIDRYAERLMRNAPDAATRALIRRVYRGRLLNRESGLRAAVRLAAHGDTFEQTSRHVPLLTDALVAAARAVRDLDVAEVAADELIAGVEDDVLTSALLAERTIGGDALARKLAFQRLRQRKAGWLVATALTQAAAGRVGVLKPFARVRLFDPLIARAVLWTAAARSLRRREV